MEDIIEQQIKNLYKNNFILAKYKEELKFWIIENYGDDFYYGELVDIVLPAMKNLYLCHNSQDILNVYNSLLIDIRENHWGISTLNQVIELVSKCAFHGEKIYKLYYPNFTEKQEKFYQKIKMEHQEYHCQEIAF